MKRAGIYFSFVHLSAFSLKLESYLLACSVSRQNLGYDSSKTFISLCLGWVYIGIDGDRGHVKVVLKRCSALLRKQVHT